MNESTTYEILKNLDGSYAVIKRGMNEKDAFSMFVPNAGTLSNARQIRDFYIKKLAEIREMKEYADAEWRKSLTKPHPYIRENPGLDICYCGNSEANDIHVEETII